MSTLLDMTGQRHGRLTILRRDPERSPRARWITRCDCGTEKSIDGVKIRAGEIASCGCLNRELKSQRGRARVRHGLSGSPTWVTWAGMKARCTNPNAVGYEYYGARGVKVCQRWMDSFEAFVADMGLRPPGLTIDRIDGSKDYEPGNCRWATPLEQVRNRSTSFLATIGEETLSVREWCRRFGIGHNPVYDLIHEGVAPAEALAAVLQRRGKQCHSLS